MSLSNYRAKISSFLNSIDAIKLPTLPSKLKRPLRFVFLIGAISTYFGGMAVFGFLAISAKDLPDPQRLWEKQRPISVQIVDRLGRDILVRGATVAPRVDLETLPFHVPLVMTAVEDRRFYNHIGVDPEALLRAMVQNVKARAYVQGGSTLTQQLSKNVFLSPEKTIRRKIQEMLMAIWLERSFTKDEILELYLSKVYFGSGAWGLEAASQRYFDKSASALNLPETAMLAGLLKAPSSYNPVNYPDRASERTAVVLDVLRSQNIIDDKMESEALAYPVRIHRPQSDNSAQYFVDWIWPQIEDILGDAPTQDVVVQTTLDLEAQQRAVAAVQKNLDKERGAEQAAVVTLDGTGSVLAMVGGTSYSESQFNRAVQAERQPGSAFKSFVYLAALEAGMSPWDKRVDAPITLSSKIDDWTPQNFTKKFAGDITLTEAFARSINTVAVLLGEEVGRDNVITTASRFGLTDLTSIRSLSLGSHVTTPLKLTHAYLPFATSGQAAEPYAILSMSTANGTPLYEAVQPNFTSVVDRKTLAEMNYMMTQAVQKGTGRRARIARRDIGGKTGTTNDFRDAWFVGYTQDIVTGIWVGNDENKSMARVTGGSIPAQIFYDYMQPQLQNTPSSQLLIASEPPWVKQDRVLENLLKSIEETLP